MRDNTVKSILNSGIWGTIGPYSVTGAALLADASGAKNAVLTYSGTAAYESVLRSLGLKRGDKVIVSKWSHPAHSLTAAAVGAVPLFAETQECGILAAKTIESFIDKNPDVKAVTVSPFSEISKISSVCRNAGIPLIIYVNGAPAATFEGNTMTSFAYAVVHDLGEYAGTRMLGMCGAVMSDDSVAYGKIFAYHNCGRDPNMGSTLTFNDTLGGNARICEFPAAFVGEISDRNISDTSEFRIMSGHSFFESAYYRKLTGTKINL